MPRPQMITDDYDDDLEKDPPPPASGALPQAIARKNARRGGTPNAPEVDDEAAPATNNGSALPQTPAQPAPPTIATMPNGGWNRARATGQWQDAEPGSMPYGESVGRAFGAIGTGRQNVLLPRTGIIAQTLTPTPAVAPAPGPSMTPAATPTTPPDISTLPQATYSNEGRQAQVIAQRRSRQPTSTPPTFPICRRGITRTDNTYTGVGGPGAGGVAAPTMTTEQANQFYGAQRQAMDAKAEQDLQENRARSMETTSKGAAAFEADQIKHGTELFHARNVLAHGGLIGAGGAAVTARDLAGRADELTKFARSPSAVAPRNLIGEQAASAQAVQTQQQNALTNPLHVEQLKQGLAAGGTAQKIAELTLAHHEQSNEAFKKAMESADPNERVQYMNIMLANQGKPPLERFKQIGGHFDLMGNYLPGSVLDTLTGESRDLGQTMQGPNAPKGPPPNHIAALQAGKVTPAQFDEKYPGWRKANGMQ